MGAFEGKRVQVTVTEEDDQPLALLARRELGLPRGKLWVAEDFGAPLPDDIQRYFDGESD